DDRLALAAVVGQRLLDVHVLPGGAGVHRHRHVPVVRRADQHGVDVLAVEDLLVFLGGERLGVGELAALVEVDVVDVADGGDADVGHLGERLHQGPAAAAGADAADGQLLVGAEDVDGRDAEGRGAGGRGGGGLGGRAAGR